MRRLEPVPDTFITDVLRCMIGLGVLVAGIGSLLRPALWSGLLAGSLLAIGLFLVTWRVGQIALHTRNFTVSMVLLQVGQGVVWLALGVAILALHVNAVGITVGVGILPTAIVLTMLWYLRP